MSSDWAPPFYVVGVSNTIWLNGGEVGDEGLTQFEGKWAGPFMTLSEAETALGQCGAEEGVRLVIYTPADGGNFLIPGDDPGGPL